MSKHPLADSAELHSVPSMLSRQKKSKKDIAIKRYSFFCIVKTKNVNKIHPRLKLNWRSKATTTDEAYFITTTTVGWIDIFKRLNQKYAITNALNIAKKRKV